jgi:hypothetical protein
MGLCAVVPVGKYRAPVAEELTGNTPVVAGSVIVAVALSVGAIEVVPDVAPLMSKLAII